MTQNFQAPEGNSFAKGNSGGSAPEGNDNAEKHGMTADPEKWFERNRENVEDDVKEMVRDWVQMAPFGWEDSGNVRLLVDAAINQCQIEQGDRYIQDKGGVETELTPTGDGEVAKRTKENPAFKYKSRLQNDTIKILNKLGILDSPEMEQAKTGTTVEDWRSYLEGSEEEE